MSEVKLHFSRACDIKRDTMTRWQAFKMWLKNIILRGGFVYVALEYKGNFFHSVKPCCMIMKGGIKSSAILRFNWETRMDFTDWANRREYTVWRTLADYFLHLPQNRDKIVNCTTCCCRAIRLDTKGMRVPDDLYRRLINGS